MMWTLLAMIACNGGDTDPGFGAGELDAENCEDGIDNDRDGLTDCEDAECAEEMRCLYEGAVMEVQVLGGDTLSYDRTHQRPQWESSIALNVYGVYGRVIILQNSDETSCEWSFDSGYGSVEWGPTQFWAENTEPFSVERTGWAIDSDCTLNADDILPSLTIGSSSFWTLGSVPWYVGNGTTAFTSTTYYEAAAYGNVVGYALSHWGWDTLDEGQVHSFEVE
jgi:hypothetical protein